MSARVTKVQITLLQILAAYQDIDDALASYKPLVPSLKYDNAYFVEKGRRQAKKEREQLQKRIDYLRRKHYIEVKKEGEQRLIRLTSKAKYEILRLNLALHLKEQNNCGWDQKWRIVFFDVPEIQKKYRDFLRKLMRDNGFRMWQLSVWVSQRNPEPHLSAIFHYLGIKQHYELVEVDCKKCNPGLLKRFKKAK